MLELWNTLLELAVLLLTMLALLGTALLMVLSLALRWGLLIAWLTWWLWGADWRNLWPVLAQGAWIPVALLVFVVALAWAKVSPRTLNLGGFVVPNFWWQFGASVLIAGSAAFCGWLQMRWGWHPPEVALEPASPTHDEDHGHEPHHSTHEMGQGAPSQGHSPLAH